MARAYGYSFVLNPDYSEGNLVAVDVTTPTGKAVQLWAEVELVGRTAILRQFAIYGLDADPQKLGPSALSEMADAAMEEYDVDYLRIEEARRTSGANPGRVVKAIEFRRRAR